MNIAGRADRNSKLVPEPYYAAVVFTKLLVILSRTLTNHEFVIGNWLYFEVVIEFGKPFDSLLGSFVDHCLKKLSCFAGTSENQSLPVFKQNRFRNKRLFIEISEVTVRNEPIQILESCLIAHENYLMIAFQLLYVYLAGLVVDLLKLFQSLVADQTADQLHVYLCEHESIV